MRKYILCIVLLCQSLLIIAQKTIDELIQAEKNFAAYSVSHGTKEAFLKFLDSNGLVFNNGAVVNGIEFWSKKANATGVLNWRPLYAEISASGDFGYTTGPWTFQPTAKDTVVARGHYTTIWLKDKKGEWKFLLDLGVSNSPSNNDQSVWWTVPKTDPTFYSGSLKELLRTEKRFIKRTKESVTRRWSRRDVYQENYAGVYVFNRNNRLPATDTDPFLGVMNEMPESIDYKMGGWEIASSGDIGYVYGNTVINGKKDNYLRIWIRERDGWKIAVEVLRY